MPRTRLTAIYGEADLHTIDRRAAARSANMTERLLRLPEDNPAHRAAKLPVKEPDAAINYKHAQHAVGERPVDAAGRSVEVEVRVVAVAVALDAGEGREAVQKAAQARLATHRHDDKQRHPAGRRQGQSRCFPTWQR